MGGKSVERGRLSFMGVKLDDWNTGGGLSGLLFAGAGQERVSFVGELEPEGDWAE